LTEKLSGQYLNFICDVIDTRRFEFESKTFPWFCYITFVRMENRICLSRDGQVTGATWRAVTRIMARIGDLEQRAKDGQAQVGYSVTGQIKRSGDALCGLHRARGDEKREFLG
jgi:hypothetical protein